MSLVFPFVKSYHFYEYDPDRPDRIYNLKLKYLNDPTYSIHRFRLECFRCAGRSTGFAKSYRMNGKWGYW